MPSRPRSEVIDPTEVGIYHCWNRLVRQRCLFGFDRFTRQDFSHRKDWLRQQFRLLAADMGIQVLDYAILDNHLHVVLRNRPDIVADWSDKEVALRWWRVCPRRRSKDGSPSAPRASELTELRKHVNEYRQRLSTYFLDDEIGSTKSCTSIEQ